jgi:CheY-like chemotaxis protein
VTTATLMEDRRILDTEHGILVVDDDVGVRAVLDVWLKHLGYRVWLAATGLDAIDLYKQHRDQISLVLMNVSMPIVNSQRGLDALRRLNPQLCCCILSGKRHGRSDMGLREMSTETVLHRPFPLTDLEDLLATLAAPLQRQTAVQDDRWRDDGGQG